MKKLVGILNSSIRDKNVHVMSGQLVFREDENYFILEDVREELLASFDDYDRFSELSSIKEDFIYIPVKAEIANSTSFRNLNNYQVFSSNVNVNYAFILDDFVFAGDRCYIKEMLDLFFENPSESDLIFLVSMLYRMGYYDEALEIAIKNFYLISQDKIQDLNHYIDLINYAKVTLDRVNKSEVKKF